MKPGTPHYIRAAGHFACAISISLVFVAQTCTGCDHQEPAWDPPFERAVEPLYAKGVRPFCSFEGLDSILDTGGDPQTICDILRSRVRWRAESIDYWQYPYECLQRGYGDCEDLAFLVAALLQRDGYDGSILFAWGEWQGDSHAWIILPDEPGGLVEISNLMIDDSMPTDSIGKQRFVWIVVGPDWRH